MGRLQNNANHLTFSPSHLLFSILISPPFFQIIAAEVFHFWNVLLFGDGEHGNVHKIEPIDIAAEYVAGPRSASQGVGRGETGVPATAVGVCMGHVADNTADIATQRAICKTRREEQSKNKGNMLTILALIIAALSVASSIVIALVK